MDTWMTYRRGWRFYDNTTWRLTSRSVLWGLVREILGLRDQYPGNRGKFEQSASCQWSEAPVKCEESLTFDRMHYCSRPLHVKVGGQLSALFRVLRKHAHFRWDQGVDESFQLLKAYLAHLHKIADLVPWEPLLLYLAISEQKVSTSLMVERDKEQILVYYVSHTLTGTELNYPLIGSSPMPQNWQTGSSTPTLKLTKWRASPTTPSRMSSRSWINQANY